MRLTYKLNRLLWIALDWIYPPVCAGCGKQNSRLCQECLDQINKITAIQCVVCGNLISDTQTVCHQCMEDTVYLSSISSWAEYHGPTRLAILSLKYKQNIGLADTLSEFLISLVSRKQMQIDLIIPIPLGRVRQKSRGFNQSALLASPLSQYFDIPMSNNAVQRIKETGSQVDLTALERNINMEGAFLGNSAKLRGRNVLLVDDIITTGATMNHCAKAILESGARCVHAISVAKTIRTDTHP